MVVLKRSVCFSLILCALHVQAQNFLRYDLKDGLPSAIVYSIEEDKDGNLLVGTIGGGFARFNGLHFEVISERHGLSMNYVTDIHPDIRGRLWIATDNGISVVEGDKIRTLLTDSLGWSEISYLAPDEDERIWFTHPLHGIGYVMQDLSVHKFHSERSALDSAKVLQVSFDRNNKCIWALTQKALFRIGADKKTDVFYSAATETLNFVLPELQGILVGTSSGVIQISQSGRVKDTKAYIEKNVTYLYRDRSHKLWAVADNFLFKDEQGVADAPRNVHTLFQDHEHNIWVGGRDGLFKYLGETITAFHDNVFNHKPIRAIAQDANGKYFLINDDGIFSSDGHHFARLQFETQSEPLKGFNSLAIQRDGTLWIGSPKGLLCVRKNTLSVLTKHDGLADDRVYTILIDSLNRVWVGTRKGASVIDDSGIRNYSTRDGLEEGAVTILQQNRGRVLAFTHFGISEFKDNRFHRLYADKELFFRRVNVFVEDHLGNLWIGRSGFGVTRIDSQTKSKTNVTTAHGLTSDWVLNMIVEKDGSVLVGTNKGLDRLWFNDTGQLTATKSFFRREMQQVIATSVRSFYRDYRGRLWFGGWETDREGVYIYDPKAERRNIYPPRVTIVSVTEEGSERNRVKDANKDTENLFLYSNKNLHFSYHATSLTYPEGVWYRYRLKGISEAWSAPTRHTEAVFTNLTPGTYTFEVKAANADGIWNEKPVGFAFAITPPFWMTAWFKIICTAIILAGGIAIYRFKVRVKLRKALHNERQQQKQAEEVRKIIARDFHDNVGNKLIGIKMYTSLVRNKINGQDKTLSDLLLYIERDSQSLFEGTRDFIWSIDPESDNLVEVYGYIRDFAEVFFERCGIEFFSEVKSNTVLEGTLKLGQSRHIVLIFKECITNTAKHAQATQVRLVLTIEADRFEFVYEDNGKGFTIDAVNKGNGIRNITARAREIGCSVQFLRPTTSSGTSISLKGKALNTNLKYDEKIFSKT